MPNLFMHRLRTPSPLRKKQTSLKDLRWDIAYYSIATNERIETAFFSEIAEPRYPTKGLIVLLFTNSCV